MINSGASASHIGRRHHALTWRGRLIRGLAVLEIHRAEMVEEADEDDDEQNGHKPDQEIFGRRKAGADDRQFAQEQRERRRPGDGDSPGKPQERRASAAASADGGCCGCASCRQVRMTTPAPKNMADLLSE